jgi:threonine/homoserine/homoserine lactone efflux protein
MAPVLGVELWVVVVGWMLAGGSPGPATLAISSTAMGQGRRAGLALAFGVLIGSALLGCAAALGMAAVMMANVWVFEVIRYVGAAYLLWLAIKSLRAAWYGRAISAKVGGSGRSFLRGLALHLTNPKAILAWGAIYAIALPAGASGADVWALFAILIAASTVVFLGYAVMFSSPRIARAYGRAARVFDAGFGLLFGAASIRVLTARIVPG